MLTKKQAELVKELKRVYKACQKAGLNFVCIDDALSACKESSYLKAESDLIERYGPTYCQNPSDNLREMDSFDYEHIGWGVNAGN